jgi:hypothetical protein
VGRRAAFRDGKVRPVLVRTFHQDWPDHIDGSEHGDVEYELTKEQWQRRQA